MSPPRGVAGKHAEPIRFSRRTPVIGLASVAAVLVLYSLGTVVIGRFGGSPKAQTDAAVWAPSASAKASSAGPATADSPSTGATTLSPSLAFAGPSPTSRPSSTRGTAAPADTKICRLAEHDGTFFLYVTSDATHTFTACAGATPFVGTIGQLLSSAPGMDRRCLVDPDYDSHNHGDTTVAVYSDRMRQNLTAARAYCNATGGGARD
jgi:hypothetical protein